MRIFDIKTSDIIRQLIEKYWWFRLIWSLSILLGLVLVAVSLLLTILMILSNTIGKGNSEKDFIVFSIIILLIASPFLYGILWYGIFRLILYITKGN